jgi:hypothetical protein
VIKRPKSKSKFKIFPIPKYLRIKNKVKKRASENPLLESAKRVAKEKRKAKKIKKKNKGTIPKVSGSTK